MKKIFAGFVALTLMLCTVASAAEYKVSVPETEQVKEGTYREKTETVDVTLMVATSVLALTDSRDVVAQLKVESDSEKPVAVTLKLEIPEGKRESGNTAIDYIDFLVKDSEGTDMFKESDERETGANTREILLGVLNEDDADASEVYELYMSSNKELKMSELANRPADIEWTLELNSDEDVVAAAIQKLSSNAGNEKTITVTVDTATDKSGGKIAAGLYGFTGKGACSIKSVDGDRDLSFELSADEAEAKYINLKQGDIITVTGGADAKLQLLNPSADGAGNNTTKATNSANNGKTSTTGAGNNTKKNPKTGDNSPIALAAVAAVAAMGLMVYTTRTKKRED